MVPSEQVPGAIVECDVFKGASFCRFAMFRELSGLSEQKRLIGFDIFGKFPATDHEADKEPLKRFISNAGDQSISPEDLMRALKNKNTDKNVELVEGDIRQTVPAFVKNHPDLRISLLNLDTDVYEPAVVILEHLFPRISKGGVLVIDDYNAFPGETKAVNDYFSGRDVQIKKFPYSATPHYLVKS